MAYYLQVERFSYLCIFFFSSRRRHTRLQGDWSSDVCSSDLRHKRAARRRALRFIASELRSNMLVAGWAARLPQPAPVQTPVLDRLAHVLRLELGRAAQVRDRPRDLENPVIRPRREREPGDRGTEQRVGALRHAAE